MGIIVDECNPPRPGHINASSIDIKMIDLYLDVDIAEDIVVVVGVNISWDKPEIKFGDLTRYQLWIGLQPLPEDDLNPEGIVNINFSVKVRHESISSYPMV